MSLPEDAEDAMAMAAASRLAEPVLARLAAVVVKRGVSLGNLSDTDRELALVLAATVLPPGSACSEAEVNQALRRGLQAELAFLDTDHVELRRWLVDAGLWRRDGYGRVYEPVPTAALGAGQQPVARALAGLDLPAWVADQQRLSDARRDARRAAWATRQGAASD